MDKVYYQYRDALKTANQLMDDLGGEMEGDSLGMGVIRKEVDLTNEEKQYLLAVERGDIPSARQFLKNGHARLNINCVDPLGRTALLIAIENENIEMIELLLCHNIEIGDALLHAIEEENVEAVELILNHELANKGEQALHHTVPSSSFTPDITPIILAAHRDNYEIIKILLDRGYRIPKPHDVRCSCKHCVIQSREDSLRHSRSRINAYRALASPSLIALSSKDPILTSFELSWELRRLSKLENEFKVDYEKLARKCQEFAVDLLEQTRGSKELEIVLNHDTSNPAAIEQELITNDKMKLSRLKLAVKYKQKKFVSHPNCQQLLASLWYEGLPGFRRQNIVCKLLITICIGFMFPILCIMYLIAPRTSPGNLIRKPFIKFICHSSSYLTFLFLLIMVSQRVKIPNLDTQPTENVSKGSKSELRGAPATTIEWMILCYVAGLIWAEIKQLWDEGAHEYIHDMWNILDFVTNSLYIATLTLRVIAYLQVKRERERGLQTAFMERKDWDAYDPNLIAEALFAAANIFSSLKLIYIFTVNPHLGPLQISLGRMIMDIMKFGAVYFLVLFSFACGLNHLYWYYSTLRKEECNNLHIQASCDRKYESFANLFEIVQSLYWAIYGLVDLDHAELQEPHEFTEFVGKLMFGTYSWIAFVVLLNLLIAMMSSSYQNISSQADEEWKFARSKLWISYFEDTGTLPAPFNIIPSPKTFFYLLLWFKNKLCACSKQQKRSRWQSIRKIVKKINEREIRYQAVMRDLIKRYIMFKQRGPLRGDGVTEDDINELKQDISSFRFELLEILRNNGMKTPNPNQPKPSNRRLSRRKNQRSLEHLKKSFIMSNIADTTTHTVDQVTLPTQLVFTHPPPVTSSITYGNSIPETIIEESYEHNISVKKKNSISKNSVPVKSVPYSGSMSERKSLYKSREATSQSTDSTSTCDSVNIPLEDSAETGDVSDLEEGRVPTDSDGNFSDQQSEFFRVNSVRSHHGKISPNNSRLQNTVDFLLESKSRGSTRETKIVKRVKFM